MSALSEQIKPSLSDSKDSLCTLKKCLILLLVASGISTFGVFAPWEETHNFNKRKVTPVAHASCLGFDLVSWGKGVGMFFFILSVVLLPQI